MLGQEGQAQSQTLHPELFLLVGIQEALLRQQGSATGRKEDTGVNEQVIAGDHVLVETFRRQYRTSLRGVPRDCGTLGLYPPTPVTHWLKAIPRGINSPVLRTCAPSTVPARL